MGSVLGGGAEAYIGEEEEELGREGAPPRGHNEV